MRRISLLLLTLVLFFSCVFPGHGENLDKPISEWDDDALIRAAIDTLAAAWQEEYEHGKYSYPAGEHPVDIRSTRLIRIKETLEETEEKYFGDIAYIVDFLIYDDYFSLTNSAPGHGVGYFDQSGWNNTVQIYRDGHMECVTTSAIRRYQAQTYKQDFTAFIEEVVDYHSQYNQVYTIVTR